ncbi:methyltransferase [Shewanella sp. KJ2020]|uniref:methyltransferase n=1 Tax=Shewanella sp. KJ2020 TaxID=2919172 RepID=UPI0020A77347|nr:methyltransferase [Shewanella sp. KJ2020]MCP3127489.1 SAM-dependent methyltransferase [Shewanella sp. KJ2020]
MPFYSAPRDITAFDAKFEAQKIAFGPISFQVAHCLLKFNILATIDKAGGNGITLAELSQSTQVSEYALGVLLDMGLSMGLVWQKDVTYVLDKTGYFLLHDDMAAINLNFVQDVCYQGLFQLDKALADGTAAGLAVFGEWSTIYPALKDLPPKAKESWFAFDHYYSDHAFPAIIPFVFKHNPRHLVDIGGNTGKWAFTCCQYDPEVEVTIMDFPGQLAVAAQQAAKQGYSSRVHTFATDLLDESLPFVEGADTYWMSQFLDCFSKSQILSILKRTANAMAQDSQLFIVETFWDRQPSAASAYCVNATSLYFSAMANGNSRMYHSKDVLALLQQAGLYVDEDTDNLGLGHTLLRCKLKPI